MGVIGEYLDKLLPPWLAGPQGQAFQTAFGDVGDSLRDDAAFGVKEAMLEESTSDALDYHARNTGIRRVNLETTPSLLSVLRNRWNFWRFSGATTAIEYHLGRLGFNQVSVVSQLDLLLQGVVNPFGNVQGFFYVQIVLPSLPLAHWGDVGVNWEKPEGPNLWDWGGSAGLIAQINEAKYLIQKFKPAPTSCRFIVVGDGTLRRETLWGEKNWNAFNWAAPGFFGNFLIFPMWERWEFNPVTQAYPPFYNYSFTVQ